MEQDVISASQSYVEVIAISVLVVGAVVAHLLRRLTHHGLNRLDGLLAQYSATEVSYLSPGMIRGIENIVFWLVVVVAVVASLRILGVGGFSTVLDNIVSYVPRLVVALTIVGAGHLTGLVCRGLIARLSDTIQPDSAIPRLVHGSILIVALVVGVQQLKIDISFVTQLLLVLLGIAAGGLVLSFALGSRQHVANLIGRSELGRYAVGDRIRIDGQEGTIVEIRPTGLDLVTGNGVLSVPAARFSEVIVLKLGDRADAE